MAEGRNKLDALNRENEISELFRIVQSASINRAFCSFAIEGTWGCWQDIRDNKLTMGAQF